MSKISTKHAIIIGILLIAFGIVMRLLPHAPNATPIVALAIVGGAYIGGRYAFALPLVAMFISDLAIGFYDWRLMLSVYASVALIGFLAYWSGKRRSLVSIGIATLGSSIFFFLATNAAVWFFSPWYEKSIAGLLYCYELGLPFFRNMIAGDVLYVTALVFAFETAHALIRKRKSYSVLNS